MSDYFPNLRIKHTSHIRVGTKPNPHCAPFLRQRVHSISCLWKTQGHIKLNYYMINFHYLFDFMMQGGCNEYPWPWLGSKIAQGWGADADFVDLNSTCHLKSNVLAFSFFKYCLCSYTIWHIGKQWSAFMMKPKNDRIKV